MNYSLTLGFHMKDLFWFTQSEDKHRLSVAFSLHGVPVEVLQIPCRRVGKGPQPHTRGQICQEMLRTCNLQEIEIFIWKFVAKDSCSVLKTALLMNKTFLCAHFYKEILWEVLLL